MAYILRFVQRYRPENREAFLELEGEFARMEERREGYPKGRRSQPYAGREQTCTIVWECEFETLAAAEAGLALMESDPEHEVLYRKQVPFIEETYTEIYEVLEF